MQALQQTLEKYCAAHPAHIDCYRSTLIPDDDNKVLYVLFEAGSTRNTVMHEMIVDRFWLQMDHDFMPQVAMDQFQGKR